MKKQIKLQSRYREDKNYLNRIGDETSRRYSLQTEFNYLRVGIVEGDPNTYSFVDPSGGPFMQKGTIIDGNKIKSISRGEEGVIIEFEE